MEDYHPQQAKSPRGGGPKTFDPLGRYELIERIGEGGMGRVYKALDHQLQRYVAVKFFFESNGDTEKQRVQIEQEVRNHAALQHPNIVTIYDHGFSERGPYTVMELVDGPTLQQRVEERRLTVKEFLVIARQALEGLKAAHQIGMLHRDLKAPNIMLTTSDRGLMRVKILDFGLSKKISKPEVQTTDQENGVLGSINTMAPEQFNLQKIDERTDLYSMGCIFYYCLSGEFPFDGKNAEDIMVSHLRHRVKPLQTVCPRVPPALSAWVMRMISCKPSGRPSSATTALRELLEISNNPDLLRLDVPKKTPVMTWVLWGSVVLAVVAALLALRFLPQIIALSTPQTALVATDEADSHSVPLLSQREPVASLATSSDAPDASDLAISTDPDSLVSTVSGSTNFLLPTDVAAIIRTGAAQENVTIRGIPAKAVKKPDTEIWVILFRIENRRQQAAHVLVPDDLYRITGHELRRLLGKEVEFVGTVRSNFGQVEVLVNSPEDIRLIE